MTSDQTQGDGTTELTSPSDDFSPKPLRKTRRRPQMKGRKPVSHKPLWTADQIRKKLRTYDRAPFLDLLGAWLECAPSPEAILEFAERWPDRYASSLLSIGRIAGFAERREISADITGRIQLDTMSDSQLEDTLRTLAYEMGIPLPPVLELQALPTPISPTEDKAPSEDQGANK